MNQFLIAPILLVLKTYLLVIPLQKHRRNPQTRNSQIPRQNRKTQGNPPNRKTRKIPIFLNSDGQEPPVMSEQV